MLLHKKRSLFLLCQLIASLALLAGALHWLLRPAVGDDGADRAYLPVVARAHAGRTLSGRLTLRDPLTGGGPYTLRAQLGARTVASTTLAADATRYTLHIPPDVPPGSRLTLRAHDAAGIAARGALSVTLPAAATLEQPLTIDLRPNVLLLISDDQRHDEMWAMPLTQARIFTPGVAFERAYIANSTCCPARATLLTGLQSHHTNIFLNTDYFAPAVATQTFPAALHAAGYFTGQIGKYLNTWSARFNHAPRPEFDFWASQTLYETGGVMQVNGQPVRVHPYGTYALGELGALFLDRARAHSAQPFMLAISFGAPHLPATPAAEDADRFRDLPPLRPPNFNPLDLSDKPAFVADDARLTAAQIADLDDLRIRRLQTLAALDRTVAALVDRLAADGTLTNTIVIYLSDNGYQLGEFRHVGKRRPYEASSRVPLAIRFDRLVQTPRAVATPVGNADIAPTLLDLAGLHVPPLDGVSLRPLLAADGAQAAQAAAVHAAHGVPTDRPAPLPVDRLLGRAAVVLHGLVEQTDYVGLHDGRYVWLEHRGQRSELYDLATDPYQLYNRADDPTYAPVAQALAQALAAERARWRPYVQLYFDEPHGSVRAGAYKPWLAVSAPPTLTQPLTFTWQSPGQPTRVRRVHADRDRHADWLWTQPGETLITVSVRAADGTTAMRAMGISVLPNLPPTLLAAHGALSVTAGTPVTFSGSFSDMPGDRVTLTASAGGLTYAPLAQPAGSGRWQLTLLAPADATQQTLWLTATDRLGAQATLPLTLTVTPVARRAPLTIAGALTLRDPLTGDPLTGDPLTGDPLTGDPLTGDPLTGGGPYTLRAQLAGRTVASTTLAADATRYTLHIPPDVPPGSRLTLRAHDAAGIAARGALSVTLPAAGATLTQPLTLDFRPNFLVLVTDDQRYDQMIALPQVRAALFGRGVTFERAYVSNANCCPSRVSLLTGLYSHSSGVYANPHDFGDRPTYPKLLKQAGYYTGWIGKYTNPHTFRNGHAPLPEFDYWSPNTGYSYVTTQIIDGRPTVVRQYGTYAQRDFAAHFLAQAAATAADRPFMLTLNFLAPHYPWIPAPEDLGAFADHPPHRPPSFNASAALLAGKPALLAAQPLLGPAAIAEIDRHPMLETLLAVDRSIVTLLDALAADGRLSNTVVLFTSDNGLHLGEFRLTGKATIYEEAIHVPLGVRFDRLIAQPFVSDRLVANVDVMPTLLDLAGVPLPAPVDGVSLRPLLEAGPQAAAPALSSTVLITDPLTGRSAILLDGIDGRTDNIGLHTGRYVYAEHFAQTSELYDLANDPYQLTNLIGNPAYAAIERELAAALRRERLRWGPRVQLFGGHQRVHPGYTYAGSADEWVAAVWPPTYTLPLTFNWQVAGQPTRQVVVNDHSDRVTWLWSAPQYEPVTITVSGPDLPPTRYTNLIEIWPNEPPQLVINRSVVTVPVGLPLILPGWVSDAAGDVVTVTASFGSVARDPDGRRLTWHSPPTSVPQTLTLTLTATDRLGAHSRVQVTLHIVAQGAYRNTWLPLLRRD